MSERLEALTQYRNFQAKINKIVVVGPIPHPDYDKCPDECDSKHAHEMMRHRVGQQKESMEGSARIKDLECSTPVDDAPKPIPNAAADFGPHEYGKYPVAGGPRKTPSGEIAQDLICGLAIRDVIEIINCLKLAKGATEQSLVEFAEQILREKIS